MQKNAERMSSDNENKVKGENKDENDPDSRR